MFGGLGGLAAWEAMQPRRKKCARCGLHYQKGLEKCRWCGELDDAGLAELQERIDREHLGNKSLGQVFFVLAAAIAMIALLL